MHADGTLIANPLHIYCKPTAHSLHTHCTPTAHLLQTHCTFIAHSLQTHCTFIANPLHIHDSLNASWWHTHCTPTAHSLHTHCTLVASTFIAHSLHTRCTRIASYLGHRDNCVEDNVVTRRILEDCTRQELSQSRVSSKSIVSQLEFLLTCAEEESRHEYELTEHAVDQQTTCPPASERPSQ